MTKHIIREVKLTRKLVSLFIILIIALSIAISALSFKGVSAQSTPYHVSGSLGPYDNEFFMVYAVKTNDQVLVSISPTSGEFYNSYIYFPNQTLFQEKTNTGGSHSYRFIAEISGDYLFSIKSIYGTSNFNYTIDSSHVISSEDQAAPFIAQGLTQPYLTIQQNIYNVKANSLVLISISPSSGEFYNSHIYFPNQTSLVQEKRNIGGTHAYNFIAQVSGDYLLSFETIYSTSKFNYTIKSSNPLSPGPTPTPTVHNPTPTPIILPPMTMTINTGIEVNFTIQSNLVTDSHGPYIYDFGDGKNTTTFDQTVGHKYTSAGNYTVMITIPQNNGVAIIQTYVVTAVDGGIDWRLIVAIIGVIITAIGVSVTIITNWRKRRRKRKSPNTLSTGTK